MIPEVEKAIAEIRYLFDGHPVDVSSESQGGAYVTVEGLELGSQYSPSVSWLGFLITFQYPHADVYPHFVDPALKRIDGTPLGQGFSGPRAWRDRQAIQISRRSNRLDPSLDTAATKLAKVLAWLRSR